MTDYETLAALGFTRTAADDSETGSLRESSRAELGSDARAVSEYPSRRSLRSAAPVSIAADAVAAPQAPAAPAAPGSRRAAREAREAAARSASVPAVAAPFGVFAEPAPLVAATPEPSRGHRPATRPAEARPTARTAAARPAAARTVRPTGVRKRVSVAGTMVLVGGLFVSLTLPAFASTDYTGDLADASAASAPEDNQQLALSAKIADVAPAAEIRDSYESISASDLQRQYRDALRQKRMAEYLASGAQALGDDYPWATELGMSQGGGLSPLRYFVRQCVDFVAWRLNRDAGSYGYPFKYDWSDLTPGGGNASSWKWQWDVHGWKTSKTPAPGWVAWFPGINHVAYVNSVLANGSVLIEEYNWGGRDVYNQRIIDAGSAIYLSPPPR